MFCTGPPQSTKKSVLAFSGFWSSRHRTVTNSCVSPDQAQSTPLYTIKVFERDSLKPKPFLFSTHKTIRSCSQNVLRNEEPLNLSYPFSLHVPTGSPELYQAMDLQLPSGEYYKSCKTLSVIYLQNFSFEAD